MKTNSNYATWGDNLTHGSLFSGIGGFDLAASWCGIGTLWQVENDPFCQKELAKHFPEARQYGDINEIDFGELEPVDIISGGFPCQPFSVAGKQEGTGDDCYLWPKMLDVIRAVRPTWVIGENVPGIINMELDKALSDLEGEDYTCRPFVIPACAVDAPHRRDRVWILANRQKLKCDVGKREQHQTAREIQCKVRGIDCTLADTESEQTSREGQIGLLPEPAQCCRWETEPNVGRVADGVPGRVDRLRALGNAVVPQIPEIIGRFIMAQHNPSLNR